MTLYVYNILVWPQEGKFFLFGHSTHSLVCGVATSMHILQQIKVYLHPVVTTQKLMAGEAYLKTRFREVTTASFTHEAGEKK